MSDRIIVVAVILAVIVLSYHTLYEAGQGLSEHEFYGTLQPLLSPARSYLNARGLNLRGTILVAGLIASILLTIFLSFELHRKAGRLVSEVKAGL